MIADKSTQPDPLVLERYKEIVAAAGGQPNHLLAKSALYRRLSEGKQALVIPPPLSHSYPWYSVVENDECSLAFEPSEWAAPIGRQGLLINQDVWKPISGLGTTEIIVTYPGWQELGFTWRVSLKIIPAAESTATLVSRHDKSVPRLDTPERLKTECQGQAENFARWELLASSHTDAELKDLAIQEDHLGLKNSNLAHIQEHVAEQFISGVRQREQLRVAEGKPPEWSDVEVKAYADEYRKMLLGNDWVIDGDGLFRRTWVIQRLTPAVLCPEHYEAY